jgi:hypothetical protein
LRVRFRNRVFAPSPNGERRAGSGRFNAVINDSFNLQRAKIFEIELADKFRDHVHADTFLIRAFRMLAPQAEKFINAPL